MREPRYRRVVAQAPAGIGNLAVGFDVLGQALEAPHDRVSLSVREEPGVSIVAIEGAVTELPRSPESNSATAGVLRMLRDHQAEFGLEVSISKGIALGSGMGGSAASAVAGVVAADALMGLTLSPPELLAYALDGEEAATGSRHADNAASAITGGIALVVPHRVGLRLEKLPAPSNVFSAVVHPHLTVETRSARAALPQRFDQKVVIEQNACLAGFIAACYRDDPELLSLSLRDVLIEPFRARLVRGFEAVKSAALESGALGCSISGGGPSLFAWCMGQDEARSTGLAMQAAFRETGVDSDLWVSSVDAPGAEVTSACDT